MADADPQSRPDAGRLAAGAAIILLGVLLLFDRVGVLDWADRTGWWPLLVIGFGIVRMATGWDGIRSGVVFVLVGGWGLLNEFGVLQYENSWPLLLVLAGGSMVFKSLRPPSPPVEASAAGAAGSAWAGDVSGPMDARRLRRHRRGSGGAPLLWVLIIIGIVMSVQSGRRAARDGQGDSNDVIRRTAVFGQRRTVSYATHLRQAHLSAVMGQCDLDLTHAVVAPGEEAVVRVVAFMGAVRLRVPSDWIVDIQAVPALGSIRDSRRRAGNLGDADAPSGTAGRPRIVLRGFAMMGDVSIRN